MARTHDRIRRSFVEAASASPATAAAKTAATRGSAPEATPAAPESSTCGRSHGLVGVRVVGLACVSSESASESRGFPGDAMRESARVSVKPHARGGQALHRRFREYGTSDSFRALVSARRAPPGLSEGENAVAPWARAQIAARTRSARRVPTADRSSPCHPPRSNSTGRTYASKVSDVARATPDRLKVPDEHINHGACTAAGHAGRNGWFATCLWRS